MTREDIIRMAREAGFTDQDHTGVWITDGYWDEELARFANLVAAVEREACAKVCEAGIDMWPNEYHEEWNDACEDRAKSIRARGDTK